MSALGQKQPLSKYQIIASEWPLSGHTGHSVPVAAFGQKRTLTDLSIPPHLFSKGFNKVRKTYHRNHCIGIQNNCQKYPTGEFKR